MPLCALVAVFLSAVITVPIFSMKTNMPHGSPMRPTMGRRHHDTVHKTIQKASTTICNRREQASSFLRDIPSPFNEFYPHARYSVFLNCAVVILLVPRKEFDTVV